MVESNQPRLLLADDSKLIRVSANKVLSDEFDVIFAADGEEAWQRIAGDESILAAFTDLTMPNVDGFDLLERIRTAQTERIHSLPVVVVTAGEDDSLRERAYELGASDFITKPFDALNLRARARSHTSNRAQQSRLEQSSALDPQTGLYNRHYFLERLAKDRSAASRHGLDLALLYLELSDFRSLYLQHGKAVANDVLAQVGAMLRNEIRSEDTAARVGLAQFALSLPFTDAAGAQRLQERVAARFSATAFQLRDGTATLTPTLECQQVPRERDTAPQELLSELMRPSA